MVGRYFRPGSFFSLLTFFFLLFPLCSRRQFVQVGSAPPRPHSSVFALTTSKHATKFVPPLSSVEPHSLFTLLLPSLAEAVFSGQEEEDAAELLFAQPRQTSRSSSVRLSAGHVVGDAYLLGELIHSAGTLHLPAPPPPTLPNHQADISLLPSSRPTTTNRPYYSVPSISWNAPRGGMKSLGFEHRPLLTGPEEEAGCDSPLVYLGDLNFWVSAYRRPREETYTMFTPLGKGAFGEVWRAFCLDQFRCSHQEVVLKRMFVDKGERVRLSGLREIYFGRLLKAEPCCISRFIEFFQEAVQPKEEGEADQSSSQQLWLVFANEGYSLLSYFFQPNQSGALLPSNFWWSLKRHPLGVNLLRDLMQQLLTALRAAHAKHITHRDIKMDNIFLTSSFPFSLRLGDWGSAVLTAPRCAAAGSCSWQSTKERTGEEDERTTGLKERIANRMSSLYGTVGPSSLEESEGHRPPEALFGAAAEDYHRPPSYDIWGAGVVLLQMVLGAKNVFALNNKRKEAKIHHLLRRSPVAVLEEAIYLEALTELCLTPWAGQPNPSDLKKKKKTAEPQPYRRDVATADMQRGTTTTESTVEAEEEEDVTDWTDWVAGNLLGRPWRKRVASGPGGPRDDEEVLSSSSLPSSSSSLLGLSLRPSTALTAHRGMSLSSVSGSLARRRGWSVAGRTSGRLERSNHQGRLEETAEGGWQGMPEEHSDHQRERRPPAGWNERNGLFGEPNKHGSPTSQCDDLTFGRLLEKLDPVGVGLPDKRGRDLLRSLLFFDEEGRISSEEALRHPWFVEEERGRR
eukprot:GHVS01025145.1.p1 GENE.GHVS01025145.1~~GHVS01025145.1.p1  ORF type:complete len:810 (+),score=176.59 GHVS01025145.1:46-2430(+)